MQTPHDNCSPYIEYLDIEHFRSFCKRQRIEFAHPDEVNAGSGLTIVVGANNSGKTSIYKALSSLENLAPNAGTFPIIDKESKHNHGETVIKCRNCFGEERTWYYRKGTKYGNLTTNNARFGSPHPLARNIYFVSVARLWGRQVDVVDSDGVLEHELGEDRNHYDPTFYQALIETEFGNVLKIIDAHTEQKEKFNRIVESILGSRINWWVKTLNGNGAILFSNLHQHIPPGFSGSGLLSVFRIVTGLLDAHSETVVIDEPELFLHPQAQRKLAEFLSDIAKTKQVIVLSHSPYFVRFFDIKNGARLVRLSLRDGQTTAVNLSVKSPELLDVIDLSENRWTKPYLFDLVTKEIFYADSILLVEGQEDVSLLARLLERSSIRVGYTIMGYGVDGADNMGRFVNLSLVMGVRVGVLLDGDNKGRAVAKQLKEKYGDSIVVKNHGKDDIHDKCKNNIFAEGYFDKNGIIKNDENERELKQILNWFNRELSRG